MNASVPGMLVDSYWQRIHELCAMRLTMTAEERALWDSVYASVMGRSSRNDEAQGEATQAVLTRRAVTSGEAKA